MGWLKDLRERFSQPAAPRVGPRVDEPWPADGGRPAWMVDGMEATLYSGPDELEVVGESFYQEALWAAVGGRTDQPVRRDVQAVLVAESGNEYDHNAVSVWVGGLKVGHLSRADAAELRPGLLDVLRRTRTPVALDGVVVGGGPRGDRAIGFLGVWLESDLEVAPPAPAALRTGLSAAIAGDDADDSYDLGWLDQLSDNAATRLPQLRDLLKREVEPISRHFMLSELEAELYAFRDTFTGALAEYDEVVEQHHAEMDTIRPALLAKFGTLPLLETYRQATIRHTKVKDFDKARTWARRGLEVYGDDAHNQDWVLDLRKRLDRIETRVQRQSTPRPRSALVGGAHATTAPVDSGGADTSSGTEEMLVCRTCGATFTRVRTRGRKPHNCPDCRG